MSKTSTATAAAASTTILSEARTVEVGTVALKSAVAILITFDKDAGPAFAAPGTDGAFLAYASVLDSKTEGLVVKFGNETRILPDHDTTVTYVPQSVLLANTDVLQQEVKWVSTCQHVHDQDKTGLPVSWYVRVMKPGATSFSGICQACSASDSACIGGQDRKPLGDAILGKTIRYAGSCVEKREAIKAEAAKKAADKKALKDAEKAVAAAKALAAVTEAIAPATEEKAAEPEVKAAPKPRARARKTA